MAVVITRTERTEVNPFSGATESFSVVAATVDGVAVPETYSFSTTKTDAEIQGVVEEDLIRRGRWAGPLSTTPSAPRAGGPKFHVSSKLVDGVIALTEFWSTLGGVVANPGFFTPNLKRAAARIVGGVRATGTGAQLQLVEDDVVLGPVVLGSFSVPDTGGTWVEFGFSTTQPLRSGSRTYRLEGQLVGATSVEVRYVSVSLLEG